MNLLCDRLNKKVFVININLLRSMKASPISALVCLCLLFWHQILPDKFDVVSKLNSSYFS